MKVSLPLALPEFLHRNYQSPGIDDDGAVLNRVPSVQRARAGGSWLASASAHCLRDRDHRLLRFGPSQSHAGRNSLDYRGDVERLH
jgi:hypothetical protein